MSDSSDSSAGRSADSSEPEPPKPVKKKPKAQPLPVVEPNQPVPSPKIEVSQPRPVRLSKVQRDQIIADHQRGLQHPEYNVTQSNGKFRVAKRRTPISPTANISVTTPMPAPTPQPELTWVNMQQTVNENITTELHKLRKKYKKLAGKYQDKKKKDSDLIEQLFAGPPSSMPIPHELPPPPPPPPMRPPINRPSLYTRNTPLNLNNY
jgi:hypothetical protein